MERYKEEFVEFLLAAEVLRFGEFTLKSGRKAPYFINTGKFNDGQKIQALGQIYAQHCLSCGLDDVDIVFGPAYKGIPLCVATSIGLSTLQKRAVGFSFDRKEAKDHGDKGIIVGRELTDGAKVVLVEDVVTAGTTLNAIVPFIRTLAAIDLKGVVVAVDRAERGNQACSAVDEVRRSLGISVFPILTIHEIISYLERAETERAAAAKVHLDAVRGYLSQYGATE